MDTRYIEPTQTTKIQQSFSSHLNGTNEFIPPDPVAKITLPHCFQPRNFLYYAFYSKEV